MPLIPSTAGSDRDLFSTLVSIACVVAICLTIVACSFLGRVEDRVYDAANTVIQEYCVADQERRAEIRQMINDRLDGQISLTCPGDEDDGDDDGGD